MRRLNRNWIPLSPRIQTKTAASKREVVPPEYSNLQPNTTMPTYICSRKEHITTEPIFTGLRINQSENQKTNIPSPSTNTVIEALWSARFILVLSEAERTVEVIVSKVHSLLSQNTSILLLAREPTQHLTVFVVAPSRKFFPWENK